MFFQIGLALAIIELEIINEYKLFLFYSFYKKEESNKELTPILSPGNIGPMSIPSTCKQVVSIKCQNMDMRASALLGLGLR